MLHRAGFMTGLSKQSLDGMIDVVKGVERETGYTAMRRVVRSGGPPPTRSSECNGLWSQTSKLQPTPQYVHTVLVRLIRAPLEMVQ